MMTLKTATSGFFHHCKYEKNLSAKTLKFYNIDLSQFYLFMESRTFPLNIDEIDKSHVKAYLEELSVWKPKTIRRKIATLKALFNHLEFEDLITINPIRKMKIKIKEPILLPKALSFSESQALLIKAYSMISNGRKNKFTYITAVRNALVIELLFTTGSRVSEIANLKRNSVDMQSGKVTILGKGGKQRCIQLCNEETMSILRSYLELIDEFKNENNQFLLINRIGNKLSDQSIRNLVKDIAVNAKIKKKVTPHMLRHTFATLLLENDVDIKYIQAMLGHSSITTTQLYTHVNLEKQRKILSEKHPRMTFSPLI